MADGIARWFGVRKGFGFIEQADGTKVFVHHPAIDVTGLKSLNEGGDRATIKVAQGPIDLQPKMAQPHRR